MFLKLPHPLKIIFKRKIGKHRVGDKIEASKFELETKIESKIDEIKSDHVRNIESLDMKISDIASNNTYSYSEYLSTKNNIWPT